MGAGFDRPVSRLVIRPGAIGDFIVSLPAIEHLHADEVWTASAHVPLVRWGARARSIASTGLDLLGVAEPDSALLDRLRGFDEIVSWYGSNRAGFRALVESLGLPFRFLDALPPDECALHAVDFYLRQTLAPEGAVPRIAVPVRERAGAVIHPFSGSRRKNWPLDRYRELARRLAETMPVAWCCGPEDDLPEAGIRIPDLYELACRLAGARVFIGNDSGIAHLAAAVGTPVVVLFGPTDPRVWAPRGDKVSIVQAPEMAAIEAEDVLHRIRSG
jgi:ADP-heptose:LPS heptosyltransferase